jgi:ABC-type antimicrobial peptide transport system permease subunit
MGRILLIFRLAARDLRRRPAEAMLMLIVITAATATLTLGLALSGATSNPYLDTRAATAGPDVCAQSAVPAKNGGPPASLTALEHAPGVIGYSGPYPLAYPSLQAGGHSVPATANGFIVEGRDQGQAPVDQPKVIQGSWVRPGGAVILQTYAAQLGVSPGDLITLNGRRFTVAGIAVTAAFPSVNSGGLIWLTTADARSLATAASPLTYALNLKLADPASATRFANAYGTGDVLLSSWQQISSQDAKAVEFEQAALVAGSWLLGMLAIASVAVLVGGRMAEQTRRVGLLKAAGGTPRLIAAVLLAEHLALALLAAAAGLAVGWAAAPLLTSPADGLIGNAGAPSLTAVTIGVVTAAALAVALFATFVPALRAARTATIAALSDAPRAPRRRTALIALSRWLPVPLLLGLRLAARRPRRLVLSTASITITVAMIVSVLAIRQLDHASKVPGGLINPVMEGVNQVLLVITVALAILAGANAIFIARSTVADSRHALAIARALGATQEQVSAGISASQLLAALSGAILGIPAGLGLVTVTNRNGAPAGPSAWELTAVVLGTLLAMAALTAIPARIGARRPPAEILQSEAA